MKYTMQNGKTLLIVSGGSIDINFSKEYIQPILTEQVFKELVSKFNLMLAIEKNETRQREAKRQLMQQQREQKLQKLKR